MAPRRKPTTEEWTTTQVADYLGYTGDHRAAAARKQLSRWGIEATARKPGRNGENLYPVPAIRKAHEQRTGQGTRTDLRADG